jgi:phosphoribosylformimino-5-aminoimidazole carboxamide ribotide isomerase
MIIYPAIDLRQGRCVRLRQGDPKAETVYGEDPARMAQHWASLGAEWLHVVNLDGAFEKTSAHYSSLFGTNPVVRRLSSPDEELPLHPLPINLRCLRAIRQAVDVPIQFGGGLRTLDDIELAFSLGADRVILGTVAVKNPELVRRAIERWGADRIVVGIDARDGKVAIHGWQEASSVDAIDLGHAMAAIGVKRVVYTDISRDGMLSGVNVEATAKLGDTTGLLVIASGGVASIDDIRCLKRYEHYNVEGVITGQAIYTGALDLPSAIELGHQPLIRYSAGIIPYRLDGPVPRVLLLWNSFFEQWQFPRGGLEDGETELGCAVREFEEETHLRIRQLHRDQQSLLHYVTRIRNYDIERKIVYYLAEIEPGEVILGQDDHSEYRWATLDEAKMMLMETSPEQLPAYDLAASFLLG